MKIDMHCHVREGSPDSKVSLEEYIRILKDNGFDGMVVTDHDSYKGYRHWKNELKKIYGEDFVVFKGIEYDTCDAGHILVIMPEGVKMRLLELKGMPLALLIDVVHRHGGVLGPAHPCGEKYMSYTNTRSYYKSPELIKRFDFIEVFNSCEPLSSNEKAAKLAYKYQLPGVGGSDAHRPNCVGMAYTILPEPVKTETELITCLRKGSGLEAGGMLYDKTTKDKLGKANQILVYSFWVYNKAGELLKRRQRKRKAMLENPIDPIDPIEIEYLATYKKKKR